MNRMLLRTVSTFQRLHTDNCSGELLTRKVNEKIFKIHNRGHSCTKFTTVAPSQHRRTLQTPPSQRSRKFTKFHALTVTDKEYVLAIVWTVSLAWTFLVTSVFNKGTTTMDPSWKAPAPCRTGDVIQDIDTPALVIDLDKMERNLKVLPEIMKAYPGVAMRPHAKAHKCPALAKLQEEHGAIGVCCQTLTETEATIYGGGCTDILLSNQVIGKPKLRRLAECAKYGDISVCVDDIDNVRDLSKVCEEQGVRIGCVVEVNVGQERCGVEPGEPAVLLAQKIMQLEHVFFKGIQCYQGWNQHVRKSVDRSAAVDIVIDLTKKTLQAFKKHGVECHYVTGGGTGTFAFESASGVFTEVQPGSYIVMDADYGRNFSAGDRPFQDFVQSLYVLSTVQSVAGSERCVLDAGMKAVSLDSGVPLLSAHPDLIYHGGGDEHGIVKPTGPLKIGDLVWLIPGHCDPTVNLYDWLVGVRAGKVEQIWPILGRGPGV